jgi:uncharacterized membrane protein YqaE (UPF0057 family)
MVVAAYAGSRASLNKGLFMCIVYTFIAVIITILLCCLLWLPGVIYAYYLIEYDFFVDANILPEDTQSTFQGLAKFDTEHI